MKFRQECAGRPEKRLRYERNSSDLSSRNKANGWSYRPSQCYMGAQREPGIMRRSEKPLKTNLGPWHPHRPPTPTNFYFVKIWLNSRVPCIVGLLFFVSLPDAGLAQGLDHGSSCEWGTVEGRDWTKKEGVNATLLNVGFSLCHFSQALKSIFTSFEKHLSNWTEYSISLENLSSTVLNPTSSCDEISFTLIYNLIWFIPVS